MVPQVEKTKAEAILAGALQEFLENGYRGTSVDRLAKAAGVSKPTLYSYFSDKESLFEAVVLARLQRLQKEFGQIVAIVPREDMATANPKYVLRTILLTLLQTVLSNVKQNDGFFRMMMGESGRFPHLAQEVVRSIHKPIIGRLSQILQQHPGIRCQDPEMTAAMMLGSIIYFMTTQLILQSSEILPLESDRYVERLVDMAIDECV